MPESNAILDLASISLTMLRFSTPSDATEPLLAEVLLDALLVVFATMQLLQTVARGERYKELTLYI